MQFNETIHERRGCDNTHAFLTETTCEEADMAKQDIPTPEELRKLLRYEPETGKLFWRERTPDMFTEGKQSLEHKCSKWNSCYANKEALKQTKNDGYKRGLIWRQTYPAHRIAWAVFYGSWPSDQIDHINGVKDDNRISNLRDVTHAENNKNKSMQSNNTSGVNGVRWNKADRKWRAFITVEKKFKYLGGFQEIEDAIAARKAAEVKYGFHPNHGRD